MHLPPVQLSLNTELNESIREIPPSTEFQGCTTTNSCFCCYGSPTAEILNLAEFVAEGEALVYETSTQQDMERWNRQFNKLHIVFSDYIFGE